MLYSKRSSQFSVLGSQSDGLRHESWPASANSIVIVRGRFRISEILSCAREGKRRELRTTLRHLTLLFEHGEVFCNEFRVPQAAPSFFAHGLGGQFVGQRRFVGARGAERIVDIHNLQDSG